MKIIQEQVCYVQKKDIMFLFSQLDIPIPTSIMNRMFESDDSDKNLEFLVINENNKEEFVSFTRPKEISFFQDLDWIVDYNEVKNLSLDESIQLGQAIATERNDIAKKYNAMSKDEQNQNLNMLDRYYLLGYKMQSLADIIFFRQGCTSFSLPEEVEFSVLPNLSAQEKKESSIKKFIKFIFPQKKCNN